MQNKQVDQEHISAWWRRAWSRILIFVETIETSPTEYLFNRIAYLEGEVARLKNEVQTRAPAHEPHDN